MKIIQFLSVLMFLFLIVATVSMYGFDDSREYVSTIYSNLKTYRSQNDRKKFINTCQKFNDMNGTHFSLSTIDRRNLYINLQYVKNSYGTDAYPDATNDFIMVAGVIIEKSVPGGYEITGNCR